MDNKDTLRNKAKDIRKTLNLSKKSELAVQILHKNETYKNAKNIMIYYPTKYEINLLELLNDNKNFYFPKIENNNLLVCPYENNCKLEKSCFNTLEPNTNPVNSEILNLIIVPALMADEQNYRLGYGGGYYDRFLEKLNIPTICIIPKELFIEKLPSEKFDIKINQIIKV